eukprot:scaffold9.g3284.t1
MLSLGGGMRGALLGVCLLGTLLGIAAQSTGWAYGTLTADATGGVYIADRDNHRVAYVNTSGHLSNFAGTFGQSGFGGDGGPAGQALFNQPSGVALDAGGNLYIADRGNHRVRKVDAATGNISTFAGSGAASSTTLGLHRLATNMRYPAALAFCPDGSLHIVYALQYVLRVDPVTGTVTATAGNGNAGISGEGMLANQSAMTQASAVLCDAANNVYISLPVYGVIRRVNGTTGNWTTFAGMPSQWGYAGDGGPATQAQLDWVQGMALDGGANMWLAEGGNRADLLQVMRRIDAGTGIINTVSGTLRVAGYAGDGGPYNTTGVKYNNPFGLASDGSGGILIADMANHRVRHIDTATGQLSLFAGTGVAGTTGDEGPATTALVVAPRALELDGGGGYYIAERARIRHVSPARLITTVVGTGDLGVGTDAHASPSATSQRVNYPTALAFDAPNSRLYYSDTLNHRVMYLDLLVGQLYFVAGNGTPGYAGDGDPAWNTSGTNTWIDGANVWARLDSPAGIALDAATGDVYIADAGNHRVRKVDGASKVITTLAGTGAPGYSGDGGPAAAAALNTPAGLAFDSGTGDLYIADSGNHVVRRVSPGGAIATVAGNGAQGRGGDGGPATAASLSTPSAVALDPGGTLLVADTGNNVVRAVSLGGTISTAVGSGAAGFAGDDGPPLTAQLSAPRGIAVDSAYAMYIADTGNNRPAALAPTAQPPTPIAPAAIPASAQSTAQPVELGFRLWVPAVLPSQFAGGQAELELAMAAVVEQATGVAGVVARLAQAAPPGGNTTLLLQAMLEFPSRSALVAAQQLALALSGFPAPTEAALEAASLLYAGVEIDTGSVELGFRLWVPAVLSSQFAGVQAALELAMTAVVEQSTGESGVVTGLGLAGQQGANTTLYLQALVGFPTRAAFAAAQQFALALASAPAPTERALAFASALYTGVEVDRSSVTLDGFSVPEGGAGAPPASPAPPPPPAGSSSGTGKMAFASLAAIIIVIPVMVWLVIGGIRAMRLRHAAPGATRLSFGLVRPPARAS